MRSTHRSTKPTFETLEGRNMLSVTPIPLVVGHTPLVVGVVNRAIQTVERQLTPLSRSAAVQGPISVDLDGDGTPDTIELVHRAGVSHDVLRVLFGESAVHPAFVSEMTLDHIARRLIVADFDGDGRLDLFAQEGTSGAGTLLLSRPGGLFDAYREGGQHASFAVADLTGSGKDEIVYGNESSSQIPSEEATTTGELPVKNVQLADLNADGKPDLVVTTGDGNILGFEGLGNGQFSTRARELPDLFAGTGTVHVAFGKTYESYLATVVASTALNEIAVFLGHANWDLSVEQIVPVGLAPSSITMRDVTGDGIADLLVTCAGSNSLWILRGVGNGHFDAAHPVILPTGLDPTAAYVGHFNAKGQTEIVTLDRGSNAISLFENVSGTWRVEHYDSGGTGPMAGIVRDVNGDGYSDLVVANHDDGRVTIFYGSPDGLREGQTIERPGTNPAALAIGNGTSSYQFYVLDDNATRAEIITFTPLPGNVLPSDGASAPALEPTSELRIVLQQASGALADVVPTLLVELAETENPTPPAPKKTLAPDNHTGRAEGKPDEASPIDESLSVSSEGPSEMSAQRYLLNVDDVPAPALQPAPLLSSRGPAEAIESASETPTESKVEMRESEPVPMMDAEHESMTSAEQDVVWEDGLLGVMLLVGMRGAMMEYSRLPRHARAKEDERIG